MDSGHLSVLSPLAKPMYRPLDGTYTWVYTIDMPTGICPIGDHPFEYAPQPGQPRVYCSPEHQRKAATQRRIARVNTLTERRCSRCKQIKSSADFSGPTAPYCKPCRADRTREVR